MKKYIATFAALLLAFGTVTSFSQVTMGRKAGTTDKFWSHSSPAGSSGTRYAAGFYLHVGSPNDLSSAQNLGTANMSYAAHAYVVLGATAVDEISITVTGTSINDLGVRATSDTEVITIPDESVADTYFETDKKWLGLVTLAVTAGTAKTVNYGYVKYWDNQNTDFVINGVEALWLGGGNDSAPDILVRHHKATGWTYAGAGPAVPPAAVASMATDHVTEKQITTAVEGAWKRTNLSTYVDASGSEGIILEMVTTANRTFDELDVQLNITTYPGL